MSSNKVQVTIQRIEVGYDGPVRRRYSLTLSLLSLDPPNSYSSTCHLTDDEATAVSSVLDRAQRRVKGESLIPDLPATQL